MGAQIPVPYALLPTEWTRQGQPQQELPNDDPVGINTFGLDEGPGTNFRQAIPFWAELIDTLDPSNQRFGSWDVVRLAGETLPGLCTVTGKIGKRFDVKKSKGSNFATLTHQGFEPGEIKIVERIWTRQQLAALWRIMPILRLSSSSLANGQIQACEVRHPALDLMEVNAAVVRSITYPHLSTSQKGVVELEYELLEYKPKDRKNETGTANGAIYTTPTRTDESRVVLNPLVQTPKPFTNTGPSGARGR